MADVSEVDQISITVEAEIPPQSPINNAEADRRAVFKVGLLMSLIALGGIFNPPIVTTTTTTITITNGTHHFLSTAFDVAIYFNLGFGITQILLSFLPCRLPELIILANKMTEIGLAVMRITLGFGTFLVLMMASASWLVVFISIQFMIYELCYNFVDYDRISMCLHPINIFLKGSFR